MLMLRSRAATAPTAEAAPARCPVAAPIEWSLMRCALGEWTASAAPSVSEPTTTAGTAGCANTDAYTDVMAPVAAALVAFDGCPLAADPLLRALLLL